MKRVLDSDLTAEEILIRNLTQALKDIINAMGELTEYFIEDYNAGYKYLQAHEIEEIA